MDLKARIKAFSELGAILQSFITNENSNLRLKESLNLASTKNPWFIKEFELLAIENILPWLDEKRLTNWTSKYRCEVPSSNVGIIMAGNIPLVGFHDFLSTIICGHHAYIKLSGKDKHLLPSIIDILIANEPKLSTKITITEELPKTLDAIIATGSNNTARYFEYFYKNIPKIIRKNRTSIAVLTGNESPQDYALLAQDVFTYFGLGCRNVSKIYIPNTETLNKLENAFIDYKWLLKNEFYLNNLKYQKARLKTINKPFIDAGNLIFVESDEMHSPVSVINYETYENLNEVEGKLQLHNENIQCKVGKKLKKAVPLGSTQKPELEDYADNIDTMEFLTKLPVEL